MFNDRHKYILESGLGQMVLDRDPMGWDDTETEIGRSEKTYGIFLSVSNNLQFTGKSKKFLEDNYQAFGVNADVRLTKQIKHPQTDEWQLAFTGFLDFTTRKLENNKLSVDFVEGGLREILTSQMQEKFELNRKTDIKGNQITPLLPKNLLLKGREIYLVSKLDNENKDSFELLSGKWDSGGADRYAWRSPPVEISAKSDDNVQTPLEILNDKGGHSDGAGTKYYLIADRNRGVTRREFNLSFKLDSIVDDDVDFLNSVPRFRVLIRKYTGGDLFTYSEPDDIVLISVNPYDVIGQSWTFNRSDVIEPKEGESYALLFESRAAYGTSSIGDRGFMNLNFTNFSGSIDIREDSFFKQTVSPSLRAYDVGNRLTEIFTGKPCFKSALLDTDYWKDLLMSCGFWIRNMKKKEGEDKDRTMTISFEDFYKSINALEPVGYGIVTEGNKQFIALEQLRYFFRPVITIKLGQVSKVKRQTATEFIFSSLSTGYMKGGNYEKPLGLDEYNIQSNYITPVTKVNSKYEVLGASRADSYAAEQARRMQYEDYPDEDTPYDKDNFLFDCKKPGTTFEVRTWPDDFEKAPTGVYSPDTAFNLRLSPAYNRNRHAYWFNAATVKYPTDKIRYTSTEGNSELSTKMTGKPEVKENSDVLISELGNPIFEPEWIDFEVPYTQEVMDQLTGKTKIDGEFINNYYGLLQFINEKGQKEKAYLFSAKIKDKITFKALKAYGI